MQLSEIDIDIIRIELEQNYAWANLFIKMKDEYDKYPSIEVRVPIRPVSEDTTYGQFHDLAVQKTIEVIDLALSHLKQVNN